ncbi:family 16 glycosylhydrolase [Mycolicibacterium sp. BiH015]|uniref:family 16 glycosylhydrolase n=1 Tax=Mycolicibacterium sp. BiH015 TaxID=3018808 RepID=UPI0022E4CF03|nr:family 16 glycosylhydrolase [Mycolicibacterium sp. BiH015]MDA2891862.1 family 16 glycosylhydrolase [Mycolicibacterium sp. BiH015]
MTPSDSPQVQSISMSRVAAAVAFTGGATACFFLAGTPAQASAETGADSDSSDAAGPSANGEADASEPMSAKDAAEERSGDEDTDTDEDDSAATSDEDADAADADDTPAAEEEDPQAEQGHDRTRKRDTTRSSDGEDGGADDGDLDAQETTPDAARPSAPGPDDEAVSNDDAEPPATFAALARAAADTESPSFFTWIQRTFFNKTPTVSQEPDDVEVRSDGSVTGVILADDADGDVLTYSATAVAAGATVTIDDDGSFVYRPAAGSVFDGGDLFTVEVSDDAEVNGWRIHGLMGLFVPGFGSTATTTVELGAATAAGRYGWGAPRETRFSGPSALDGWVVYDSVGHNGWGRRTPRAISFVDGVMVITGDPFGNTGGLTWGGGQKYGAWEVRMKVPEGAVDYHAVALLWPDAENWPVGGEVDFVEVVADATRQHVTHHLHYSALDLTEAGVTKVDATEWHNYAVSWTPTAITIYVDGIPVWKTTDTSHFPPGPMHLALQLDASEKHPPNLAGGAQMAVAWARQYSLSQIT